MKNKVLYIHGKGGSAAEAEHYKPLFPDRDVVGFDYTASTPWEAKEEFPLFADRLLKEGGSVILIANSIGAYFSMLSLAGIKLEKAFLISPIVDMASLIENMMMAAGVSENELCENKEIQTEFGETLSWEYLEYARNNPIIWDVPTFILYGTKDCLTSYEEVRDFSDRILARLTVMKDGEHWFHTEEQMAFLDEWIRSSL